MHRIEIEFSASGQSGVLGTTKAVADALIVELNKRGVVHRITIEENDA